MSETSMISATDTKARLASAIEFARAAGEVTLGYFGRGGFEVSTKRDGTEVTTADREAERRLRELIEASFPDDGILGEEYGERESASGWRWVLDPIDGTSSFVHGVPLYGTLVACEVDRETLVGVIHMPALGETVYASSGGGAWHIARAGADPVAARVSGVGSVGDAMMCTTSFDYFRRAGLEGALGAMFDAFGSTRGWSDCYAHVLCATGRIDAVVEPVLSPWDIAPMQVIYPEAGGKTTDWSGRLGAYSPTGLSTNGRLHDEVLALLRPHAG